MAMKLYVGGLPYSTSEEELTELFAPFGTITSTSIISDRMSGRPKGFGFVEMANDTEAEAAIAALNNKEFGGRTLAVNEARPMGERRPGGNRPRGNENRFPRRY